MAVSDGAVDLDEKFAAFDELWSPKIVARFNDLHVKVVKVKGDFVWHSHPDTDEMFLVRSGWVTIEMRGRDDVTLRAGSLFVVPKGIEHRPVASEECELLLLEPAGLANTGDAEESSLTTRGEWI